MKKVDLMIADAMPEETTPYLVYRRSTSDITETHTHLSSAALDFSFHYLPRTAVVVIYNDHSAPPLLANYNIYAKAKYDIDISKNCP